MPSPRHCLNKDTVREHCSTTGLFSYWIYRAKAFGNASAHDHHAKTRFAPGIVNLRVIWVQCSAARSHAAKIVNGEAKSFGTTFCAHTESLDEAIGTSNRMRFGHSPP